MQRIDFNALVADVLSLYGWDPGAAAPAASAKALNLDVTLEAGLPAIEGDPTQLRQVIHNLLSNARDAIAELGGEGRVSVTTQLMRSEQPDRADQQALRFTVADTGGLSAAGAAAGLRALRHHQVPRDWVRIGDRAQDR